jgi:hypothetical protein
MSIFVGLAGLSSKKFEEEEKNLKVKNRDIIFI